MPKESTPQNSNNPINPSKLFTVPAEELEANYRPLTAEELKALNLPVDESTPAEISEEKIKTLDEFVKDTFKTLNSASVSGIKIKAEAVPPPEQEWSELEKDIDPTKAGEYTLNPETQELDFATAKVFIPDLSSLKDKKFSEVAEYVVKKYSDKYYIPGLEYEQWLYQHKDLESLPEGKEFEELKQHLKDRICFFFGSILRNLDGHWHVPCVDWVSSGWRRRVYLLDSGWGSLWGPLYRVVLLEK